jgi:hypothetical protein
MKLTEDDIQSDKERVKQSIKKLEKWLEEPDITESRMKALTGQLGKYQEYLQLLEAGGAVPYIKKAEEERRKKEKEKE